jgi:hypothetical protein
MNTNRPKTKLNAKMGLIVTSILSLVNAGVGTVIAVKENLPSVTLVFTTGKPALEDFLTGNGTALSPPLYLCIIALLLILLALQSKRPGMVGVVGLTILGVIFLLGEFAETSTYRVLNPVTFHLSEALVTLAAIVLALLMIVFGGVEIVQRRQAHRQGSGGRDKQSP